MSSYAIGYQQGIDDAANVTVNRLDAVVFDTAVIGSLARTTLVNLQEKHGHRQYCSCNMCGRAYNNIGWSEGLLRTLSPNR